MAKTVKIDDELMEQIGREARHMSRSLAGQVRHWVRLGMSIERSGSFDQARVSAALDGRLSPDSLNAPEQEAHIDALLDHAATGTPEQERFFAQRRAAERGAGLAAVEGTDAPAPRG